jgi:osmotically inducible protein OsmC
MAEIRRNAHAVWTGNLREGKGRMETSSGALIEKPYGFSTRFEHEPGTNPEELIAAAHAGCYSMAFSATLGDKGYAPEQIETHATCILTSKEGGGWEITGMRLKVRGRVPGLDNATFVEIAHEADQGCPVSNLLRSGLTIELDAALDAAV